jgi:hypothetical protein
MKKWKIKSTGKWEYLIIFTLVSLLFYLWIILRETLQYGGAYFDNLLESLLGYSLVIFIWLITFPYLIYKKKIPVRLTIDSKNKNIKISFSRNDSQIYDFNSLAYSFYNYNLHSVLIIHHKFIGTRGNWVYSEIVCILGIEYGFGWKRKTLIEITDHLEKLDIEFYEYPDKAFLARLFE